MPVIPLDHVPALVIIDLQQGLMGYPTVHPLTDVIAQAAALACAFRAAKLPVVLVNVAGGAPGRTEQARRAGEMPAEAMRFVPELDQQPNDLVVTKRTWGAFAGTDLEADLRRAGVTQIVIAGVATSIGVESTARQGYELGFNVVLATDAMTDTSVDAHANSVERIFPRLGETGTAADIIRLLDTRDAT